MEDKASTVAPLPIRRSDIARLFTYGFGFITVVLVALFVQKSDGNSALGTILYLGLGAAGSLLITAAAVAVRFHGRRHEHQWAWFFSRTWLVALAALVGAVALAVAFTGIDAEDTDFSTTVRSDEVARDGHGLALRNLTMTSGRDATRLLVSVINTTQAPIVADTATFTIAANGPKSCAGNFPIYQLDSAITIREDGDISDAKAAASGGPLDGFAVNVSGKIDFFCDDTTVTVQFPVNIALDPQQTTFLVLDIPRLLDVTLIDMILYSGDKKDYPIGEKDRVTLNVSADDHRWQALTLIARLGYSSDQPACIARQLVGERDEDFGQTCD